MTIFSSISGGQNPQLSLNREEVPVAAFYLYKEPLKIKTVPKKWTSKIKNILQKCTQNIGNAHINFKPDEFANNFALQCPSEFVLNYAGAVLSDVLQNKQIKSQKLLDMFFCYYAPVLNTNISSMGYANIVELRSAMTAGTVDVATFMAGLTAALSIFDQNTKLQTFRELYEELPLDVVENFEFVYVQNDVLSRRILSDGLKDKYTNQTTKVGINVVAHIHNKDGDLVRTSALIHKLEYTMAIGKTEGDYSDKGRVIFRIGKDIFENCRLTDLNAIISDSYDDVILTARLQYNIHEDLYLDTTKYENINVLNPAPELL